MSLYWTGGEWWGFGPGAHSHVGGVRWWNVKHPSAYAARLSAGRSPAAARERLTAAERSMEEIMLRLIDRSPHAAGRLVLTLKGRLLADAVVRDLT